jgi:predicted NACHT family NTPase
MTRTSYGPTKRERAWQLIAALIEKRRSLDAVRASPDNAEQIYLEVDTSLSELGAWSKLTTEQIREALTEHFGKNFLGIFLDQRQQKAGRNAERWKFKLNLWSWDPIENKRQFDLAWEKKRTGKDAEVVRSNIPSLSNELKIREHCRQKILNQHNRIRLLSGEEIKVDQLYVDVWLLNRSPRTFQSSRSNLLKTFDLRNDRLGLGDRIQDQPGFEIANLMPKLVILGKPGAGKTTFLKQLAVDWSQDNFYPELIAVLIELRQIRDKKWQIIDAISEELGLEEPSQTIALLKQGKLLVLMDRLDEVPKNSMRQVAQSQLSSIAKEYSENRFIITCRTQVIVSIPVGFSSVEVADFKPEQVKHFVENWFRASGKSDEEVREQWKTLEKAITDNSALRELTVTPVLLSLICLVLQDEGKMPSEMTWLYKKGMKLLLSKWNESKNIGDWEVGGEIYRQLSIDKKERLLTEIAAYNFEDPENFALFEEEKISGFISDFLNLNDRSEGVAVLQAIELQHGLLIERADGLWSFSHLTFQEHFTIQWLTKLPPEEIAIKLADYGWQESILGLVNSQQPADRLLMLIKQAIDRLILNEPKLQEILAWVFQKSESIDSTYKLSAVRAFYFELTRIFNFKSNDNHGIIHDNEQDDPVYGLSLGCDIDDKMSGDLSNDRSYDNALEIDRNYDRIRNFSLDLSLLDIFEINEYKLLNIDSNLDSDIIQNIETDRAVKRKQNLCLDYLLAIDLDLVRILAYAGNYIFNIDSNQIENLADIDRILKISFYLDCAFTLVSDSSPKLANELKELKAELPVFSVSDFQSYQEWWQSYSLLWSKKIRQTIIVHREIGHDWDLTDDQTQQLEKYYEANQFLIDLINIDGVVSDTARSAIEKTLLLPWEEIQQLN